MQPRQKKRATAYKAQSQPVPAQTFTFPAPIRGLTLSDSVASPEPGGARILDNWICTTKGVRVRGGARRHATVDGAVKAIWTYRTSTEQMFAATSAGFFDVTSPADPDVAVIPGVIGNTSGDYSTVQFGTAGGDYFYAVNGTDYAQLYDGTNWNPVAAAAVNEVAYDALVTDFAVGEVVTGGTSGATATVLSIQRLTATTGVLKLGAITGGPYQDNEALTSATGAATADGASGAASSVAITGVDTRNLSVVWSFASRLFFVEKNTMTAWYLPVDSIGGAVAAFSLAGIFTKGGSLLFGARWSLDAGDGLDDKCVFVSTEGEVAIYEGTNPGSATTWSKAGLYALPRPLGKKAITSAGGDLLIATEIGLVPVSAAIQTDIAAIESRSVSAPISLIWQEQAAALSGGWEIVKTPTRGVMFVSQPGTNTMLAANLMTGAWSRVVGWSADCVGYFGDYGYFGTSAGDIAQMESGGSDMGEIYTATWVAQHDPMGLYGAKKSTRQMRALFLTGTAILPKISGLVDFDVSVPAPPSSPPDTATSGWDISLWDVGIWDEAESIRRVGLWTPVGVTGDAIAPVLQLTFGIARAPKVELVSIDVQFHAGAVVA